VLAFVVVRGSQSDQGSEVCNAYARRRGPVAAYL